VLTALDDRTTGHRPGVAQVVPTASRRASIHDLLDQFADLGHAAEAATRRAARAR
jgi:hypothetical protein